MAGHVFVVSPSGDDGNPGTTESPFLTVGKAVSVLTAGDIIEVRAGVYAESVEIKDLTASKGSPTIIRSFQEEHALIDASVPEFRTAPNGDWLVGSTLDPAAHADEYISNCTFTPKSARDRVNRGAFLDGPGYTRLFTYSRLEDLRSYNEKFGNLEDGKGPDGPIVTDPGDCPQKPKRPWV